MTATTLPPVQSPASAVDPSGWGRQLQAWACASCQYSFVLDATERTPGSCPWCAQAAISPASPRVEASPELVVPFATTRDEVVTKLEGLIKKIPSWGRPDDLKSDALLARLRPIFLPTWLVDARVSCAWRCEAGFDYEVKTHRETFHKGHWQSEEVRRTHIDWEPRAGTLDHRFDNVPAPALTEQERVEETLGPFHTERARAYRATDLDRAVVLEPNLSTDQAWRQAHRDLARRQTELIKQACEAQHAEKVDLDETHHDLNWTLRLLPMWTTWYKTDEGSVRVLRFHGQTLQGEGALAGSSIKARSRTFKFLVATVILMGLGFYGPDIGGAFAQLVRVGLVFAGGCTGLLTFSPSQIAKKQISVR